MMSTHWQDWDHLLLGLWVVASPWLFGYTSETGPAAWSAWILGGALVLVAVATIVVPQTWEEPINTVLGVCLILSPWIMGFSDMMAATSSSFVAGVLVVALSCWAMVEDGKVLKWWREHHHLHWR